ncbi:MAG: DoxX family protein [Candidatus Babeliales bacterium]
MKKIFIIDRSAQAFGLTIIRIGLGIIFMAHGIPKLLAGPQTWLWLGSQMKYVGINFAPTLWGFLAACAEGIGGFMLLTGFATRLAAFGIGSVMLVALFMHYHQGDAWTTISHPLAIFVVMIGLFIAGSAQWSIDEYLVDKK